MYRLHPVQELAKPIKFDTADRTSIRSHRWSTRLGLQRARFLSEIALETESEWRLYEKLNAAGINFHIEAKPPKQLDKDDPVGRAVFNIGQYATVRYDGKNGFLVLKEGRQEYLSSIDSVVSLVKE